MCIVKRRLIDRVLLGGVDNLVDFFLNYFIIKNK